MRNFDKTIVAMIVATFVVCVIGVFFPRNHGSITPEHPKYVYNTCTHNWAVRTGEYTWYGNPSASRVYKASEDNEFISKFGPIWDTTDCVLGQEWVFTSKEKAKEDYELFLESRHARSKIKQKLDSVEAIKIATKKHLEDSLYKCEQGYK